MKIFYETGWGEAAVHFCPHNDSGIWRTETLADVPGAKGWKEANLSAAPTGAEFVMRNGEGTDWDNNQSANYKTPVSTGNWTLRNGQLMRVSESKPVLIVSDLDHTMVGHEHDGDNLLLREFQAKWLGQFAFNGSKLVYSTGRNKADALAVARERGLLRPALLICAVATEIYEVPEDLPLDSRWADDPDLITPEPGWTKKMMECFNRAKVEEILSTKFPKFEMRGCLETDPYRIPTAYEVDEDMQENLRQVREVLGPGMQVITSGGNEWKLVDFVSTEAGKMKGVQFAMQRVGIPPERTLVCGDSGNDESMYRSPGVRGVAVGNSLSELVENLQGQAKAGPQAVVHGEVFETKSGSSVLYANAPVAAAISEALDRFWPQKD